MKQCNCGLCDPCYKWRQHKESLDTGATIKPDSRWQHDNGNYYTVLMVTNLKSKRYEYPPTVVYLGDNGNVWSRPVKDWFKSMRLV